jgi:glycine cleavage system H lipoate-binding protein/ABC-type phosphate transport system substrate-binding protein
MHITNEIKIDAMKRTIILLISLLLLNYCNLSGITPEGLSNPATVDSIRVLTSPDLLNLTNKWASEYNRLNTETAIKVINITDSEMADKLTGGGRLGFVSDEYFYGAKNESLWKAVVGRDVIIPVINSKNPFLEEISQHGISQEILIQFLKTQGSGNWGMLLGNTENSIANYYQINDESIAKGMAGFLKSDKIKTDGINVESGEAMIAAIQKDPLAIGFCKMVNVLDFKNQTIAENIKLLPIDKNGNGLLDYNEKIYDDFNAFSRGVWIGKYPKTLFSNIYSVASKQPDNEKETAFLKWVITDGQQYLYSSGYSDLLVSERQTTADRLFTAKIYPGAVAGERYLLKAFILIAGLLILAFFIADSIFKIVKRKIAADNLTVPVLHPVLDENSLLVPKGIYFDKTHTWAFMDQNGVVKVGIDDFLQHITGPLTRIKMKNKGDKVKKGEQILSIVQNGKQLNLYAPVSGIIKENNKELSTNTSIINSSPYSDGWVYMIEPTNWIREIQLLAMADKYKEGLKKEFSRLKDFLALSLKSDNELYSQIILQDGGELIDNTLSDLGPEVWEEFQTKFIDPSRQVWFYELF